MFKFCSTSCILRTCDTFYSYGVPNQEMLSIHSSCFSWFSTCTPCIASKDQKFFLIFPFNSSGCRIFFVFPPDRKAAELPGSRWIHVIINSCERFLERHPGRINTRINSGINAAIGSSNPECWIHVWYSLDPDTWKLGHRVGHMILWDHHHPKQKCRVLCLYPGKAWKNSLRVHLKKIR